MRAPPTLGYHRDVVRGMMDASEPFPEVETFINEAAALDQEEKAALWLLAWSFREGWVQRREAQAMLSALAWSQAPG
jgi:alkylhydroperoxidase family enzyme